MIRLFFSRARNLLAFCRAPFTQPARNICLRSRALLSCSYLSVTDPSPLSTKFGYFSVNVKALFWVTKAFLPAMLERGEGHIVTLGSVASIIGAPRMLAATAAFDA